MSYPFAPYDTRQLTLVINEALQEASESAFEDTFTSPMLMTHATGTNDYGSTTFENNKDTEMSYLAVNQ